MSRRRPSLQKKSKKNEKSSLGRLLPFTLGGIILAAIAGYMLVKPPQMDPKTFCPQGIKDMGKTALLIDVSDKLTDNQAARLHNELINISNVATDRPSPFLQKGEMLLVYFVEPEGQVTSLVFSMCHPGDVQNRTATEKASEARFFAEKKMEEIYG